MTAYLPDFTMADGRYTDITVRMLLNHSSGLPGSTIANGFLLNDPDTLAADTLLEELSSQTLKADPRRVQRLLQRRLHPGRAGGGGGQRYGL